MKRISKLVGVNVAMCVLMIASVENAAYIHVIFQTKLSRKTVKNFRRKFTEVPQQVDSDSSEDGNILWKKVEVLVIEIEPNTYNHNTKEMTL